MRTRKEFYTMMYIYQQRLAELDLAHKNRRKGLVNKIRTYKLGIKRADGRNVAIKTVRTIHSATNEFYGVEIALNASKGGTLGKARNFYYKFCLEEGFNGAVVGSVIGRKGDAALQGRRFLATKLKSDKDLSAEYQKYKNHMSLKINKNQLKKAA